MACVCLRRLHGCKNILISRVRRTWSLEDVVGVRFPEKTLGCGAAGRRFQVPKSPGPRVQLCICGPIEVRMTYLSRVSLLPIAFVVVSHVGQGKIII